MSILPIKRMSIFLRNFRTSKFGIRYAFFLGLLLVMIMDALVIKEAWDVIRSLQTQQAPVKPKNAGVRVNFPDYEEIVKRAELAEDFRPQAANLPNPFSSQRR